ncbi:orotidine-5-phosphate decarboxylase [Lasallia pustulata]|uniref:Orotidine 5'-phosphate decarboxylase n=1 Tax=Lasallia pustulata TaxID=136370 RepID=A0A1W5DES9_9LECA|nr:orotidine-5-phosphate decarboxylase [Lasallia pustulata]
MSTPPRSSLTQPFTTRADLPNTHPLTSYLLQLITIKRSNLCVSADVTSTSALLKLAEEVGDSICVLKTHADIIDHFSDRTIMGLQEISRRKKFLIFEDRKFGDIGSEYPSPTFSPPPNPLTHPGTTTPQDR